MRLILLAVRNLTRNKRRTLITALAVLFGTMAIVVLQGFANAFLTNLLESSVLSKVGAVQVFKKGYLGSDDPLKVSMQDDPQVVSRIRGVAGVTAVAPRIDFDGMVSNGSESTMFLATAIDPVAEYQVCPKRAERVAPGSQPLRPGREGDMLMGKLMADSLGAQKNGTLVMQAAGPHASTNALDVEVTGFLPTFNIAESKRMTTVRMGFAQNLLRMKGRITEYVIAIGDLKQAEPVAARVRTALGGDYEVTTWSDLDPATQARAASISRVLWFVAVVLFLLVATGIVNTMLMSVYERVREIGTMLALGVRRWQITVLFLWEAIALGLLGALTGVGLGYAMVRWLGHRGLAMNQPGGDTKIMIYTYVELRFLLIVVGFALAGTLLSALYPAWKAARLRPVEALRAT